MFSSSDGIATLARSMTISASDVVVSHTTTSVNDGAPGKICTAGERYATS